MESSSERTCGISRSDALKDDVRCASRSGGTARAATHPPRGSIPPPRKNCDRETGRIPHQGLLSRRIAQERRPDTGSSVPRYPRARRRSRRSEDRNPTSRRRCGLSQSLQAVPSLPIKRSGNGSMIEMTITAVGSPEVATRQVGLVRPNRLTPTLAQRPEQSLRKHLRRHA